MNPDNSTIPNNPTFDNSLSPNPAQVPVSSDQPHQQTYQPNSQPTQQYQPVNPNINIAPPQDPFTATYQNVTEVPFQPVTPNPVDNTAQQYQTPANLPPAPTAVPNSQPAPHGREGFATAGMVIGIIALTLSILTLFFSVFFFPLPILGSIFSTLGMKSRHKGMAVAGLVTSILAFLIISFWIVIFIIGASMSDTTTTTNTDTSNYFEQINWKFFNSL